MKNGSNSAAAGPKSIAVERDQNPIVGAWRKSAGILPLLIFCAAFEILPIILLVGGSFESDAGGITLQNYFTVLKNSLYLSSFRYSLEISFLTALIGTSMGGIIGYLIYTASDWARNLLISLSSVTANFAGVPLAFAFTVTLGANGLVTVFLKKSMGLDLYGNGLTLYSLSGLSIVYSYFQLPLMVLLVIPAFRSLQPSWSEAAANLGASRSQYWGRVGLPILFPTIAASFFLLVANALGAYATAYGLSYTLNLITIQIGFLISGETILEPALADALATILLLLMTIMIIAYQLLAHRAEKWLAR
jgi:putative spermidine/putrescine transport system permease protein